jgi:hypothetical protein
MIFDDSIIDAERDIAEIENLLHSTPSLHENLWKVTSEPLPNLSPIPLLDTLEIQVKNTLEELNRSEEDKFLQQPVVNLIGAFLAKQISFDQGHDIPLCRHGQVMEKEIEKPPWMRANKSLRLAKAKRIKMKKIKWWKRKRWKDG